MEFSWIEDFLALAKERNFSRAAQERNVTQPAFSRRIQSLETWLGASLFRRSPHQVSLTEAGEHFRPMAEVMVRDIRKMRQEVQEVAGRARASLSIAATHALSFTFAPRLLQNGAHLSGLSKVNLISDTMEACEHLMMQGEASFLLCHVQDPSRTRLKPRQFKCRIIGHDVLIPLSLAKDGKPVWELGGQQGRIPYLAYDQASGMGRILADTWQRQEGDLNLSTIFTSRLASALLSLVRGGEGVAWLPRSLAADDLRSGLLMDAGNGRYDIAVDIALFRPVTRLSKAAEAFWDGLASVVTALPDQN